MLSKGSRIKCSPDPAGVVSSNDSLCDVLEHGFTFPKHELYLSRYLMGAELGLPYSSVTVLQKISSHFPNLRVNSQGGVRDYGDLSLEFAPRSGVREGCPISSFLLNFVTEVATDIVLSSSGNSGIDVYSDKKLSDFECADDIVLLSEDSNKLEDFLDCVNDGVGMFGTSFALSKCKVLLHNWIDRKSNVFLAREQVREVNGLSYLDIY